MKTLLKIVGAILGCLVLLLVILRITGFGPQGRMPGLWLKGNLVTTPVADWSFTDKYPTVEIQTKTWYLLPHSVTTNCVVYNGQLYVHSLYPPGVPYPYGRGWNENIVRDPHVRIKIGDNLYDAVIIHVTDPAVIAGVLQANSKKYPRMRAPANRWQIFHVLVDGTPATPAGG
jgi:hypothetical protein